MSNMLPPVLMELRANGAQAISEMAKVSAAAKSTAVQAAAAADEEAASAKASAAAAQQAADAKVLAAETASRAAVVAADKTAAAQAKAAELEKAAQQTWTDSLGVMTEAQAAAYDKQIAAAGRAADAAELAAAKEAQAVQGAAAASTAAAEAVSLANDKQVVATEKAAAAQEAALTRTGAATAKISGVAKLAGAAVIAGAVIVGAASVDMAAKFEASTTLLVTAGGESKAQIGAVRDGILQIASSTGTATSQLSDGMYVMEKAGYRGAAGLDVLKAAAEGAKGENVDLGTMTNALTSIMMSYHLTSDKAVSTTNELVAGAGAAKTTMQDYAGALSTVLPVASAAGISFAQVGGAIATLTQHGTSADESTQELANTIRGLQAPNNVAISAMQQLGLNVTDVSTHLGQRGLTGTIQMITDAIASKLGPQGTVLVDTMKKSATGAADLQTMLGKMPPALATNAKAFLDGTMSMSSFQKSFKGMGAEGDAQGKQFLALANTVSGYNDQIKQGGPAAQTAAASLKAIMGGATGMNTALMLSGENMATFKSKTQEMTDAANKNGKDISTWGDTSQTLAVKLDQVKQTVATLGIKLGGVLLPAVKNAADAVMGFLGYMETHKDVAQAVGIGLGVVAAGLAVYTIQQLLANAALMTFVGTVLLPVVAIAALIAAVVLAYNKIGWFKDGVNAVFSFIGTVVRGFIGWVTGSFVPVMVGIWSGIVTVWNVAVQVITNIFNTIMTVGKVVAVVIGTVVIAPMVIAFNVLSAAVTWMWKNVWEPAWHGISDVAGAVWKWLSTNVFSPIGAAIDVLGKAFNLLWQTYVVPVWNGIQDAISTVWQWLSINVFTPIGKELDLLGTGFNILWKTYVQPAWSGIQSAANTAWTWIRDNVFSPFKTGIDDIGKAFDATQSFIGTAWDKIKSAAAAPVHWIVDTVYTKGIEKVWNGIASAVGLDLKLPDAPAFADGGVYGVRPGYTPGRDTHLIAVGGGEAIMRPEWARAMGADRVHAMNAMARSGNVSGIRKVLGLQGYADGGIFGAIGGAVGGAANAVGGFVGGAVNTAVDIAGDVAKFVADPMGSITNLIKGPVQALLGMVPGGNLGKMVGQLPLEVIGSLGKAAVAGFQKLVGAGGSGGGSPVSDPGGGVDRWTGTVLQALAMVGQPAGLLNTTLRRMNQESGGNPNAINNWDSNAAAGIPSKGLMQVIGPTFASNAMPGYNSNIYDPLSNILASMRYAIGRYGSLAAAYNQPGGYASGGVVPVFDNGGTLAPGLNTVRNNTGGPEPLVRPGHGGGVKNYYITVNAQTNADPNKIARELGWQLSQMA